MGGIGVDMGVGGGRWIGTGGAGGGAGRAGRCLGLQGSGQSLLVNTSGPMDGADAGAATQERPRRGSTHRRQAVGTMRGGYKVVTRGLRGGYDVVTSGLRGCYDVVTSGLRVGYEGAHGGDMVVEGIRGAKHHTSAHLHTHR
eukprot:350532-Chlamydomonas_euryale.AAC.2